MFGVENFGGWNHKLLTLLFMFEFEIYFRK